MAKVYAARRRTPEVGLPAACESHSAIGTNHRRSPTEGEDANYGGVAQLRRPTWGLDGFRNF